MSEIFTVPHLRDILIMICLFTAMAAAYRRRFSLPLHLGISAACLAGFMGSILLQENYFSSYIIYMLLLVIWGCIYSSASLQGPANWKTAMVAGYCCNMFHMARVAALFTLILPASLSNSQYAR